MLLAVYGVKVLHVCIASEWLRHIANIVWPTKVATNAYCHHGCLHGYK